MSESGNRGYNPDAEPPKDYKSMGFYEILGVARNASGGTIKKAFREKIKIAHPDVGNQDDEYAKYLTEAYNALKNKDSRDKYDAKQAGEYSRSSPPPRQSESTPNEATNEHEQDQSAVNTEQEVKEKADKSKNAWAERAKASQGRWNTRNIK